MRGIKENRIGLGLLGIMIIAFFGYVAVQYFIIVAKPHSGFVGTKVDLQGISFRPWIYFLYIHIISGTIALLAGPLQFSQKLRQKNRNAHRYIGKMYVLSILISFLVGIYLAFFATGGITGTIGFLSLDIVWILTTLTGLNKIKKRDISAHKEWMLRSYAITLTFVTFRIFSIIPLTVEDTPGILFGLTVVFSWVLNLFIAEWVIRVKKTKKYRLPKRTPVSN